MSKEIEKVKNIYQRLNDVQKIVQSVFKTSTIAITHNKSYKAVTHDEVASILHLPLANAGIFVEVSMETCKVEQMTTESTYNNVTTKKYSYMATVEMSVKFVNSDNPSDFFSTRQMAYAFDSGDKAVGKAQSMAVKYAYLKNLNLESTDDEEQRVNTAYSPNEYQQQKPQYPKPQLKNPNVIAPPTQANKPQESTSSSDLSKTIAQIKIAMTSLTQGQTMEEKQESMSKLLKVSSFYDLNKKPLGELQRTLKELNNAPFSNQVTKQVEQKKPTFNLNQR